MAISPGGRPADASPVGTPGGQQNWVDKAGGLPKYVRMVAHALMRKGMPKQHAIASAVNRIKRWAAGMDDVRPQVQAAAVAALAEWNAKKGMALSAHVDAAQLLDMSVPDVWLAELEGTFDPARTLDLAREYVRDQVGKFANDNTKNRGADQHRAAQEDEKRIERNRQVRPADLSSLKGIRQLMLDWRRVPFTERAANKARMKSAARRLGATPRLLALIDGLGDGDMKAEKSEGAGVALRHDKANAWLKSQGFNLSTDDTEAGLVLELAAAVGDELDSASLIDLAGAPGETIDLAPGDYHPPYDWKHGYIPITPAAALSKAKKGPHVGKGNSRRPKGVRVAGRGRVSAPNAGKAKPTTAAGARGKVAGKPKTTSDPAKMTRPALEAEFRRVDAEHETARRAGDHSRRDRRNALAAELDKRNTHAKALDDEARGRGVPGAVEATKPDAFPVNQLPAREKREYADLTPEGQKAYRIERKAGASHRDARTAGRRAQTKPTRSPGHQGLADRNRGQTVNMPPPTSSDAVQRAAVKTNQGPESDSPLSTAQLEEMAKSGRPAIAAAAKRQLEKRKGGGSPKGGAADSGDRISNREAAGATDTGKARRLAADRVLLDGQQYERVVGPNGGYTWRGSGNADVKDMDTRRKLDEAAPLSGSAVAARRVADNRKTEAEGGPSATPPTRTERALFPEGQKVAYNGRPSDGTGVVVGRRTDSQGTILRVKDDKDGKTYEWAPDHVKPHDTASGPAFGGRTGGVRTPEREQPWEPRPGSAPSTSSTNPDAPIRIEHTPDGTLVHGTTREDAAAIKEVGGFKWSRNLNAWYLPRTWRPETRENKVRQLEAKLGDRAGVDKTTGPRKSAAEREADTRARAGERAERMDARADKRSAEAERRFEAADLREEKSGIPFGQPILVGHHSERRHRRALDRAHANMGKGVEAQRDAESARDAADRARRTAAGTESKVTIGNRIAKNEREVRDLERRLNGTHSSSRRKPEGEYRQRLEGMLAEARDQLQHDRGKMAAAGGVPSKESVSPGDFVKIRGQWYPVRKANAKTVGVPNTYGDRTRTAPWHEVSEHRKAGDVTRADVADMVRDTSQAFPNLKTALAKAAPEKDADTLPNRTRSDTVGNMTPTETSSDKPLPAWVAKANAAESDVRPAYQLGHRQREQWAKLTDPQRREANTLMATRPDMNASQALAQVGGTKAVALPTTDKDAAYKAGRAASKRSTTADLDAAEARFLRRYGHEHVDAFIAGWSDHASGGDGKPNTPAGQSAGAAPKAEKPAAPTATPGGVTPDAARRMSDEQLERTMQRLMADGDYDGPAFSVIEKELNRRDKARRAEGNQ